MLGGGCAGGETVGSDEPGLGGSSSTTMRSEQSTSDDGDSDSQGPGPGGPTGDSATITGTGQTSGDCQSMLWARDVDEDGYGDPTDVTEACEAPAGFVDDDTDCDDTDDTVYPGANEPCGGPDKNCDFESPPLCNSCSQLLASGNGSASGVYTIDADGPDEPIPPNQVFCDQDTDGGGWTLVQRTVWDPAQTNALRTEFATWENQTIGNPNPGQGFRLQGAAWGHLNLQLEHLLRHEIRQTDGEACDPLFYLGDAGELSIGSGTAFLTGLVSDAPIVSGTELSTADSGPSQGCINASMGVPWFYASCCATCPIYRGDYWTEPHPMANYVHTVPDMNGNTETEVCAGTPEMAINGSTFRGIQSMEYYLR